MGVVDSWTSSFNGNPARMYDFPIVDHLFSEAVGQTQGCSCYLSAQEL
jgi:hypothetical protein